jgi:transcriptional regulator with XRE-family HTH domain
MHKTGADLLRDFMTRSGRNQQELADFLDITHAYLSQLLNGVRNPSLPLAARFEELTAIPMRAWALTARGKLRKRRVHVSVEPLDVAKS